jgi:hypothetical protein
MLSDGCYLLPMLLLSLNIAKNVGFMSYYAMLAVLLICFLYAFYDGEYKSLCNSMFFRKWRQTRVSCRDRCHCHHEHLMDQLYHHHVCRTVTSIYIRDQNVLNLHFWTLQHIRVSAVVRDTKQGLIFIVLFWAPVFFNFHIRLFKSTSWTCDLSGYCRKAGLLLAQAVGNLMFMQLAGTVLDRALDRCWIEVLLVEMLKC